MDYRKLLNIHSANEDCIGISLIFYHPHALLNLPNQEVFIDSLITNFVSAKSAYNKPHCYQYDIRLKNLNDDLKEMGMTKDESEMLSVSDFEFKFVDKTEKELCGQITKFITRHEWLGKMPHRPTHRFIATYKGHIAGAVVMATPNSFSNLLGEENRNLEKLIARGACISWSPKNLGSALIMFAVRWMVRHTEFRSFTAYSDTEARELGTIYQACNFIYLGTEFGGRAEYFDAYNPKRGWFSDRLFRKASQYRRYAESLGIAWDDAWGDRKKIYWEVIPDPIVQQLKLEAKRVESLCTKREVPRKHKYVHILGRSKTETKKLHTLFTELNPKMASLPYPKNRIPVEAKEARVTNFAATEESKMQVRPLNFKPPECRPREQQTKSYLTIKEAAKMYGLSQWTLYQFIKTDPSFPYLNVGLKKKFVVDGETLLEWMENRTKRDQNKIFHLPTPSELLAKQKQQRSVA